MRRLVRRVPGAQALYRELRTQTALRRRIVTLDHPRAGARIHVRTRWTARMRVRPVEKEPWTVRWIEESLRPGDVLWDVGANVGAYSLIAAKLQPAARVVAVEPGPANYAALCENVFLNGLDEAIVPLPVALGESSRIGSFALVDPQSGAGTHRLDASEPTGRVQAVVVQTIDDLVERFAVPAPTLIKIDVDGAEPAVLGGSAASLARPELRSVLVEVETGNDDEVIGALGRHDLALVERIDDRDGLPLPGVWYGIFERRSAG